MSALQPPSIYFWTGVRTWLTARLQDARMNIIFLLSPLFFYVPGLERIKQERINAEYDVVYGFNCRMLV